LTSTTIGTYNGRMDLNGKVAVVVNDVRAQQPVGERLPDA
jgi:hypothetical protein